MRIEVQEAPFDLGRETSDFASGHKDMGAIVTFTGVVRDLARGDLDRMEIEHYPGMTERALEKIVEEAKRIIASVGNTGHVMNLGHGIEATTPEENAALFINTVHAVEH